MPFVVVAGATFQCSHGGQSKVPAGNSKFKLNGAAAVTSGMEIGIAFLPAGSPPTPNNPLPCPIVIAGVPSPCAATLAALPVGVSSKITVGGVGVLLDTASGLATNSGAQAQLGPSAMRDNQ